MYEIYARTVSKRHVPSLSSFVNQAVIFLNFGAPFIQAVLAFLVGAPI